METFFKKLNRCLGWQYLQDKSEYGFPASERGFVTVAVDNAGILASALGLDEYLTKALTLVRGIFFPAYGRAGLTAVLEYIQDRGYGYMEEELGKTFALYDLWESGMTPPEGFPLDELFSAKALQSSIPEVRLAAICYAHAQRVKPFYAVSQEKYNAVEEDTFKKLKTACLEKGEPIWLEELDFLGAPEIATQADEATKQVIYAALDSSIAYNGDVLKGILETIETGS